MSEMAACGSRDKYKGNASRNLYRLIHRKGKTLPVEITSVVAPIRASRRRKVQNRPWPVLHLSKWLNVHFGPPYDGFFLLGGHRLKDLDEVEAMLSRFWAKHATVDPDVPRVPQRTVPYLLHGDEGRGQLKRPLLVVSYQPIISWSGEDFVNSKKSFGILEDQFLFCQLCFFTHGHACCFFFTNASMCEAFLHDKDAVYCSPFRELRSSRSHPAEATCKLSGGCQSSLYPWF